MLTADPTHEGLDPALLCAIEDATLAGLATVDAGGRQTYVNPKFCHMLGYDANELLGLLAPFPYWPDDQIDAIQDAFDRTVRGEAPADGFRLQFRRKDGLRINVRLLISPLLAVDGESVWLASVYEANVATPAEKDRDEGNIDADARGETQIFNADAQMQHRILAAALHGEQQARADAERSLALFESILETAPVGLSFLDRDLRYVRINQRLADLNGVTIEQTVGRLQRDVVPDVAGRLEAVHRQVLQSGKAVIDIDLTVVTRASPIPRQFEASVFPVLDAAGKPWMVGTVVRETTAEKHLQAEQLALHERLLRAEALAERAQTEANERRFRCLAEATSDIVWQTDANGLIQVDSPSWRAFTGQSLKTWLGNNGWEALHPDDRPIVASVWADAVRRRERFVIEYRLCRHDGVYVPMSVRGAPVLDEAGEVIEWIGANIDISARIEHEAERQRLLESEQRAHAEAEAARARMALLDRITARLVGETRGANLVMQTLAEMLVETIGEWCAVHVPLADGSIGVAAVTHRDPAQAQATREHVARYPVDPNLDWGVPQVIRSGRSERAEVTDELIDAYTADPQERAQLRAWNLGSYIIVPLTAQGRVVGALSLTRDAEHAAFNADELALAEEIGVRAGLSFEQARLLQEAQAARAEAEAAGRARDEFLAMLGHELRNPLAPIVTALDLMKRREGQDLSRERGILERQVRHMTRLVDDLLDVSRIACGKIELRLEPVNLAEICSRAVETAQQLFDGKRQVIEIAVDDGLNITGDPARLEQIVCNLLTNAAKYTPIGGRALLEARCQGSDAVIVVSDNGVGIDDALLPHVFDLFIQGGQSIERAAGGLGLGLTIVRRLVAAHGGQVSAASEGPDQGSRFTVVLPLTGSALQIVSGPEVPIQAPGSRSARILVVDDNEDAATLLAQVLDSFGFETRVTHSGPSAIELTRNWRPDSLLLDIGLPGMDGFEVARRLRSEYGDAAPLLVAVTGYGQPSDRAKALAAGFSHHLVKPVDIEQLRGILVQQRALL